MSENIRRLTLEQARKLKTLSNAKRVNEMSDDEIDQLIAGDPDLYQLTDAELAQFQIARKPRNGQR